MERNKIVANRLQELFINGRWIANTNYKEILLSIDWQQALAKIQNLNTIASLTYHINYYLAGLLNAFETGQLNISDKYSFDLPTITSEEDWKALINKLFKNAEMFIAKVLRMDDQILDRIFIDPKYGTYSRNIEGVIEHSYYHLGQVSLIKKLIMQGQN